VLARVRSLSLNACCVPFVKTHLPRWRSALKPTGRKLISGTGNALKRAKLIRMSPNASRHSLSDVRAGAGAHAPAEQAQVHA